MPLHCAHFSFFNTICSLEELQSQQEPEQGSFIALPHGGVVLACHLPVNPQHCCMWVGDGLRSAPSLMASLCTQTEAFLWARFKVRPMEVVEEEKEQFLPPR